MTFEQKELKSIFIFDSPNMLMLSEASRLAVSVQIEPHSQLAQQERLFGHTKINFGENSFQNIVIFG